MKVSVLIPSYNHSRYIEEAVESVLAQDWPDVDLIVIDDGSTDESPRLLQALQQKHGSFQLLCRENRGLIATLNEGLSMATGEAVCLLASDDYLPQGSLKCRAEVLSADGSLAAVYGEGFGVNASGEVQEEMLDDFRRCMFREADPVALFLKGKNIPIHLLLMRKSLLDRIGGFDSRYRNCEDLDVQLLLFLTGGFCYIEAPVYHYRTHGENISIKNPHIATADKVRCFEKLLTEVPRLASYRGQISYRLRRQYLKLGRMINGGQCRSNEDEQLFAGGWRYAWQDPRLLWHLIRHFIRN